jgi:glycosyltransferase involved in cell wall biosynthesis
MAARIRNSTQPKVSVIIPLMNERRTIAAVIRQSYKIHKETEVIVVANGSTDGSKEIALQMGTKVISFDKPLGHDVGRSIGAAEAKGEYLLFIDGDIVIPAIKLTPFIRALDNGVDIALNKYLGAIRKSVVHNVVLAKHALNTCLSLSKLKGASLTTIPHAIRREAVEKIGIEHLAVPPKAQAVATWLGLNIQAVHYVNVGSTNPRKRKKIRPDPVEQLIMGDHLEAIHWYLQQTNARGNLTDLNRKRELVRL